RDWHAGGAVPDPIRVARAVHRIAEIVAFAHGKGIVHRDLKPANILVPRGDGEPTFRITDFGIGGIASKQARNATLKGTIAVQSQIAGLRGSFTANYASPEQINNGDPDPRDDVHALGVIWYQMLVGDLTKGRPRRFGLEAKARRIAGHL